MILSVVITGFPIVRAIKVQAADGDYLPGITAVGGYERVDVTLTPAEENPGDYQYNIYIDDQLVSNYDPVIQAEAYSKQYGVVHDKNKPDKTEGSDSTATIDNVGGTHRDDWTMYEGIDFGIGQNFYFTARYSAAYDSVGTNPKLEIYIDSDIADNKISGGTLIGTLDIVKESSEKDWTIFKTTSTTLSAEGGITGKHNVFIKYCVDESESKNVCNLDWFSIVPDTMQMNFTNVAPGTRKISVKTVANDTVSTNENSIIVIVNAITSDAVGVECFQIRTKDTDKSGVAFRAVCKAPNIGSVIVANDGENYTVTDMGTIYSLNRDGIINTDSTYMIQTLLTGIREDEDGTKYEYQYYKGANYNDTYGYIATSKGVFSGWNETDPENTYYIRTMTKCDNYIATSFYVRAFVVAESADGDEFIIYGQDTAEMTIAEVADYLYTNSMSSNYQGHEFLYNKILSVEQDIVGNLNRYFRTTKVSYGWSDNLFTPDEPIICPPEYGKVDSEA